MPNPLFNIIFTNGSKYNGNCYIKPFVYDNLTRDQINDLIPILEEEEGCMVYTKPSYVKNKKGETKKYLNSCLNLEFKIKE